MHSSAPIRVMIVDDHELLRGGLALFLGACSDLQLVGQGANGAEAVRLVEQAHPDVVLMDLVMPEMDGVTATSAIRQAHPEIQVIALTSFSDADLVQRALQAGAIGYLLKNASIDEISAAIYAAQRGKPTLAPEAFRVLVNASPPIGPSGYDLTAREREILRLMAEGLNNHEIAERLAISLSTVKTHISNLLTKLRVGNRIEAISLALQCHLAEEPTQD